MRLYTLGLLVVMGCGVEMGGDKSEVAAADPGRVEYTRHDWAIDATVMLCGANRCGRPGHVDELRNVDPCPQAVLAELDGDEPAVTTDATRAACRAAALELGADACDGHFAFPDACQPL